MWQLATFLMAWRTNSKWLATFVLWLFCGITESSTLAAIERLPGYHQLPSGQRFQVELIATGLNIPWDMEFAADGALLVTERPGRLILIDAQGARELDRISDVLMRGEAGLMGFALYQQSRDQRYIFLCYSAQKGLFGVENRLVKALLGRFGLLQQEQLLSWRGDKFHNGCQVAIGPDQKLYVTTGDATEGPLAQQPESLLGKVLRLELDGSIPADNPIAGSAVYSIGHRNPQGLTWHPGRQQLYVVEHGPSGFDGVPGGDELNLIRPGENYGWPNINRAEQRAGLVAPLYWWEQSVAPAALAFSGSEDRGDGRGKGLHSAEHLVITTLVGEALIWLELDRAGNPLSEHRMLHQQFGRLRALTPGPDGHLYFATSNRDGRGQPAVGDDRILRLIKVSR